MSLISKPSDLVMDRAADGARLIGPSVVPIFRSNDRVQPDFEGSGVLLRIADHHFLVSAAHVFDACKSGVFLLADGNERSSLTNAPWTTEPPSGKKRAGDKIDLGVVELTNEEVQALGSENFIGTGGLSPRDAHARKAGYFAFGYPGRLQERDDRKTLYKTSAAYYVTVESPPRGYELCKLVRDSHLLLRYDRRKVVNQRGGGVPEFKGLSGGGVFRVNGLESYRPDNKPKLVAITIEQPECFGKSILTTRVEVLLAAIRQVAPDTVDAIPPSPLLQVNVKLAQRLHGATG